MANDKLHILLTGVTRGLGLELMQRFNEKGHFVIGCGRDSARIQQLQKELPSHRALSVVDVSSDEQVKAWAEKVLKQFPPPDFLLNNAALMNPLKPFWQITATEFDPIMDVNIKGVANVIRHFVPAMVERGTGMIINFSSGWGRSTSAEVAPYCASKYAIEGLSKALADDLPKTMGCIPLNPGIIDTDMLRSCFQSSASHYPDAKHWSHQAAEYILKLTPRESGLSKSIPST